MSRAHTADMDSRVSKASRAGGVSKASRVQCGVSEVSRAQHGVSEVSRAHAVDMDSRVSGDWRNMLQSVTMCMATCDCQYLSNQVAILVLLLLSGSTGRCSPTVPVGMKLTLLPPAWLSRVIVVLVLMAAISPGHGTYFMYPGSRSSEVCSR